MGLTDTIVSGSDSSSAGATASETASMLASTVVIWITTVVESASSFCKSLPEKTPVLDGSMQGLQVSSPSRITTETELGSALLPSTAALWSSSINS